MYLDILSTLSVKTNLKGHTLNSDNMSNIAPVKYLDTAEAARVKC